MDGLVRRWVVACAAAEAVGMTAASAAAKGSQAVVGEGDRRILLALGLVVAGGLVEGLSLGAAQSWALQATHPRHLRRRYVVVTVLLAGLGWAGASAPGVLADPSGIQPRQALVVLGGAGLGVVMGFLLGAAQAWVLAPAVTRPRAWIVANVCAWTPAMALVFLGATTPGPGWPWWQVVPLGCATGAVAGAALGLVLSRWVPRLGVRPPRRAVPRPHAELGR